MRVWRQRFLPWHSWVRNRCLSVAAEHSRAMLAGVAVITSALQYCNLIHDEREGSNNLKGNRKKH